MKRFELSCKPVTSCGHELPDWLMVRRYKTLEGAMRARKMFLSCGWKETKWQIMDNRDNSVYKYDFGELNSGA